MHARSSSCLLSMDKPCTRLSGVTHIFVHVTYISYKRYLHHLEYEIGVTYIFLRFYRSQLKNVYSLISPTLCVIVGRTVHLLYELNINNQLRLFIGDVLRRIQHRITHSQTEWWRDLTVHVWWCCPCSWMTDRIIGTNYYHSSCTHIARVFTNPPDTHRFDSCWERSVLYRRM